MRHLPREHRSPGFALENFDAVGRWRTLGEGRSPIDASGSLPGAAAFEGVAGLRQAVLARPDVFVGTLTEKLLTFALGRGIDYKDAPAVRQIRRDSARDDYRFSSLVAGDCEEHAVSDAKIGRIEETSLMTITKMSLPRRTFLRGMGAAVALPLLDAMVPALSAVAKTAAARCAGWGSSTFRWG